MMEDVEKLTILRGEDLNWESDGRRGFFEYCDLGMRKATSGRYLVHLIRATASMESPIGGHRHIVDLQVVYMLKGWMKLWHEGHGEVTLKAGDCMYQPGGLTHGALDWSADFECLEVISPGNFSTLEAETEAA
ncbi:cupin domain-containing protein [Cupriavidus necator]|uniref:cupin domain-containing protein n=1 Tax=Cupriavidus necator TaxID=106590 RepID=UPI003ECD8FBA